MKKWQKMSLATSLGVIPLCCCCIAIIPGVWPFEVFGTLAIGWILFLARVFQEMTLDWDGFLTATLAVGGLSIGLHFFLRWFYAAVQKQRQTLDTVATIWRPRWTAAILSVVVLMFTAGIAAVGMTHQATWLARSPDPLLEGGLRQIAGKTLSAHYIKQMDMAVHEFNDVKRSLPAGGTFDKYGRALHGWQTALLPYLEQQSLYEQIKLDVPWNDPANSEPFKRQVVQFQHSFADESHDSAGYALSHYATNVRVIGGGPALKFEDIAKADGLSNTLLLGQAAGNYRPWGHHANWRDPALGINTTAEGFGNPVLRGAQFAMADGSVRFISNTVSPTILKALSTPNGGEKVNIDDIDPR